MYIGILGLFRHTYKICASHTIAQIQAIKTPTTTGRHFLVGVDDSLAHACGVGLRGIRMLYAAARRATQQLIVEPAIK